MPAPRNRRGFYTSAALKDGFRDQYAVHRTYGRVTVELYHDGTATWAYHVALVIHRGSVVETVDTAFLSLDEARKRFSSLVRKHP